MYSWYIHAYKKDEPDKDKKKGNNDILNYSRRYRKLKGIFEKESNKPKLLEKSNILTKKPKLIINTTTKIDLKDINQF